MEVPDTTLNQDSYASNPSLLIGTNEPRTSFFKGEIDDVSIWKIALDRKKVRDKRTIFIHTSYSLIPSDIISIVFSLYQAKNLVYAVLSGQEEGLVAYYSFNQDPGKNTKYNIIIDLSLSIFISLSYVLFNVYRR